MTEDERKRLLDHMKKSDPPYATILERLEKGQ
jgi:hypothetical protein